VERDRRGRRVIHRTWRNTDGQLHRTTGPAVEHWTVLPGGAHVLSLQGWYVNGKLHREGRPAWRIWHVAGDGTRVLIHKEWWRHGRWHRVSGPAYRYLTVEPDGTRRLAREWWRVNGVQHRVDGPAQTGPDGFYWHGVEVRQEDLPWLRRGRTALAAWTVPIASQQGVCGSAVSPAWSRDPRVTLLGAGLLSTAPATYRSVVGGIVFVSV